MSADNGVYILETPGDMGPEYRVAHAQAIENLTYGDPDGNEEYMVILFGKSKIHSSFGDALKEASDVADEILADPICPILEYGICDIKLSKRFPKEVK